MLDHGLAPNHKGINPGKDMTRVKILCSLSMVLNRVTRVE